MAAQKYGHISEWVAGDVSSKRHVCHHVYPGRGMIKTMTNNFVIPLTLCKFRTSPLWPFQFTNLALSICYFGVILGVYSVYYITLLILNIDGALRNLI